MLRNTSIRATLEALAFARAPAWLPAAPDCAGFVVTLHHVAPAEPSPFQPNALLSITPEFLDSFLGHFIAAGWRFMSVDELLAPSEGRPDPRRIAVTLDDGYRDNLAHAWAVFRRHNVPFAIYVCPGFCDRKAELWWEALERIIAGTDAVAVPGGSGATKLGTRSRQEKERAFRLWKKWLTTEADEATQRKAIRALSEKHGLDLAALAGSLVMDWSEVATIADDRLCTIGAHTMTHAALARLPAELAAREIRESVERITAEIGKRPKSFAFPYGYPEAAGAREALLTEQAGLMSSFTTQPGYIPASGTRHGLPRVSINGLFQQLRYLDVLLSSGVWTLRNRFHKAR